MFIQRKPAPAFTLIEAVLALSILATGLLAFYVTLSRALLLSETNKQIKVALFDAQSVVEEIQGMPFNNIMDPDNPTAQNPSPRFRHRQEIPHTRLFGKDPATGLANSPRLEDEKIVVWYGAELDLADDNKNGDFADALPLPIVPGSDKLTHLSPAEAPSGVPPIPEQYRPANNTAGQFVTPEPLYITVEVSWVGPSKAFDKDGNYIRMFQRLTFVRSR
jgi:hypothetical protein